ncbi:MAG: KpsF/GutQ family sugar-phosphate isomerase, partial [Planctomycetota bacterium]
MNLLNDPKTTAERVFDSEITAIQTTRKHLDSNFETATRLILESRSHLVVSGLGKSGLVGQKLSATFASTGTPSHFLHPTEAVHGDLGRIRLGDVVLLLSYSGRTEEVSALAAILRQDDVPIISISKSPVSQLGQLSDAALAVGDIEEACQHGLAPTSTTTAMMALGDALAIAVSTERNFSADEFGRSHPGGTLGKTMMPIKDFIRFRVGENVIVGHCETTVKELLEKGESLSRRCGAILISNSTTGQLKGILTDSDLRRSLISHGTEILNQPIKRIMSKNPVCMERNLPLKEALQIIRERRLDELPIVDKEGIPVGVLDVQDLIALKL